MTTVVVGLDGASWNLLEPWIKDGSLPNIERIRMEGICADLRSCLPPVTSPNWKCYSTGKNPGKLGVYWWEIVDKAGRNIRTPQSSDYRSAELWDYLNDAGKQTAVINMPTTFPPHEINGWMIAGGPGTDSEGYAMPEELEAELKQEGYSVRPKEAIESRTDGYEAAVAAHHQAIESRFDLAEQAIESGEFEFVHVTTFYINVLQHFFWNGEPTYQAWQLIDNRIGDILDMVDRIILMSDHGCNEIRWEFRINQWLENQGYLTLKSGSAVSELLGRIGATRSRLRRLANIVPFDPRAVVPESLKKTVPSEQGTLHRTAKASIIDWEATTAVASGQGPVYVLAESDERMRIIENLMDEFEALTDPEGNHACQAVHKGRDIYEDEYMSNAPDIVIEQAAGYHLPGSLSGGDVFSKPTRWLGENKQTGLFAAYGKDFDDSGRLEEPLNITDLCPTLLHLLGEPIPDDVDGIVRSDVFADGSSPKSRAVEQRSPISHTAKEQVLTEGTEGQLRDLGYL